MTQSGPCRNMGFEPFQRRRSKTDWAGVHLGDAFKHTIDYMLRATAQRSFYQLIRKVQKAVAGHLGACETPFTPAAKPQIGPCYTTYPSALAALASIGLTGFLEFKARVKEKVLSASIPSLGALLWNDPAAYVPSALRGLSSQLIDLIETRLLFEELSRLPSASFVESYRLFLASQQPLAFVSVPEIARCVIMYGDIVPHLSSYPLNQVARAIFNNLTRCSAPYLAALPEAAEYDLLRLGQDWAREVLMCLMPYMPESEEDREAQRDGRFKTHVAESDSGDRHHGRDRPLWSEGQENYPPCNAGPPLLDDPPLQTSIMATLLKEQLGKVMGDAEREELIGTATALTEAVKKAGMQSNSADDMRSDLVGYALIASAWTNGPMEGNPAYGAQVLVCFGEQEAAGEIFEQALSLSDDFQGLESLIEQSRPLTDALSRILYPNITKVPVAERLASSGSLDPTRLAAAWNSDVIYRRLRMHDVTDRKGSPVLLIACDGSASLDQHQIHMLKILTAAWLQSTAKTRIQVVAGLYHSGAVRENLTGPLVEWVCHPQKTVAASRMDSLRALAGLPGFGVGAQSDALSLSFMLDDARKLARGRMVYLVVISDCMWNVSFPGKGMTGAKEVESFFKEAYRQSEGRLHTTLVALGLRGKTGLEDIVDKVIPVSVENTVDAAGVAQTIGTYVASCVRERKAKRAKAPADQRRKRTGGAQGGQE